jgi:hypothetical protein
MLTGTVKGQLMGAYGETFGRQGRGKNLFIGVNKKIVHPPTLLADKMLMAFQRGIKMLRAIQGQHLQFSLKHELLKIPINCP